MSEIEAAIAGLTPPQRDVLLGEAVRQGDVLVMRVFSPATRCSLARKGILVDRQYSETLTPFGEQVRERLLAMRPHGERRE